MRTDVPQLFLAESSEVMSRVLALHLVARLPAGEVSSTARLEEMRTALLEERWDAALLAWIDETGVPVDVFADAPRVFGEKDLDLEQATLEIKIAPLFSDAPGPDPAR